MSIPWQIEAHDKVETEILSLPPKLQAKLLKIFELIEKHGPQIGEPHVKPLKKNLFEIRVKSTDGIARGLFCYARIKTVIVLRVFAKKTQKIPKKELALAKQRMREILL